MTHVARPFSIERYQRSHHFRIRSSSAEQPVVRGKAEGASPSGSANLQRRPVPGNDVSVPTEPSPRRPPKSAGATSAWCSSNMLGLGPSDRRCKSCRADHFSELKAVYEIFVAREFSRGGLGTELLLVLVHSGSRGLGETILCVRVDEHQAVAGETSSFTTADFRHRYCPTAPHCLDSRRSAQILQVAAGLGAVATPAFVRECKAARAVCPSSRAWPVRVRPRMPLSE